MDEEIKVLDDDELEKSFAYDSLGMYFQEICQYPVLSKEEQKKLACLYKENNDLKARERLINCNLRLVVRIAMRYRSKIKHFQILDLVQEGTFGLIRAIETYDPNKGAFSTYAGHWILHGITQSLYKKNNEIRKPTHIIYATHKYITLINEYKQNGLPLPTDDDICDILDISMETLKYIRITYYQDNMVSLNQAINDDHENDLDAIVSVESGDYERVMNTIVDVDLCQVFRHIFLKDVIDRI